MTKISIEVELETNQFTDIPIMEQVIKRAIEGSFFIDVNVTKIKVSKVDEVPAEGIQEKTDIR